MSTETDDLTREFISETQPLIQEVLEGLEHQRLDLDKVQKGEMESLHRCVHQVRGAAGFLGFSNVERLAQALEEVLGLLCNEDLRPSLPIFDSLHENAEVLMRVLDDLEHQDEFDLEEQVGDLKDLAERDLEPAVVRSLEEQREVQQTETGEDLGYCFLTSRFELERAANLGLKLYRLELDLMEHYQGKGRNLLSLVADLTRFGLILDSGADLSGVGRLDEDGFQPAAMPLFVLLASRDEVHELREHWGLDPERILVAHNPVD